MASLKYRVIVREKEINFTVIALCSWNYFMHVLEPVLKFSTYNIIYLI